jgi:arginase family enzyme
MNDLHSFFASKHFAGLPGNDAANPLQIGKKIQALTAMENDWTEADIILIGCGEQRGSNEDTTWSYAPNAVREALYKMYDWHPSVKVADMGNILEGAGVSDTRAALRTVLEEVRNAGKIAIILGGSQDLTLQQYDVFKRGAQTINAAVIDSLIDLEDAENISDRGFLMEMLTGSPNFVRQFSLLGFQSYNVNPDMLETLDKLRFDCYRLGVVREDMEEMEPVLRNCDLLSIDLKVLRHSEAPFLKGGSPNGLFGDELCQLARYAGMSKDLSSLGIYGYRAENDPERQGAQLIAQMLWYFVDGYLIRKSESNPDNREDYFAFHVNLNEEDTLFLKSKKTNRWWMQLPGGSFTPCTYKDYLKAGSNEFPERWLREQERIV